MLFFGYKVIILLLFHLILSLDVKSLLEDCSDDSVVSIPEGFYYSDSIEVSSKENVEIETDGTVVIECADEGIMNPTSNTWTKDGSFYKTIYTKNSCSTTQVYAAYGSSISSDPYNIELYSERTQVWSYSSYDSLSEHVTGEGVFFDTSTQFLYIFLEDDKNPNSLPLNQQLFVSCGRCLEIKRSNGMTFSNTDPFIIDNGAEFGVLVDKCESIHFDNVHIYGGFNGIRFFTDTTTSGIENSIVRGFPRNDDWTWNDYKKNTIMLGDGIGFKKSQTSNYCNYNDVSGYFNGITAQNSETGYSTDQCNNNLIISNNFIYEIQDDAFEIEPCNINVQIFRNVAYNTYTGVSFAPVTYGPVYFYQNLVIADKIVPYSRPDGISSPKCMKMVSGYGDPPENAKMYFNTFIAPYGKVIYGNTKEELGIENFEFYNNIFWQVYKDYGETQCIIKYSGLSSKGNEYDYNIHYTQDYEMGATSMYTYYNSFSENGFDTLSEALSSPEGSSSGWAGHSLEGDPKVTLLLSNPKYYILDPDSIAYESAGDVIPGDWPLDDSLSSKPVSERHIGVNDILRDYFMCYGELPGCSDHGTCIDEDTCDCDDFYDGDECEIYNPTGIECYDISKSDIQNVCSGRGECVTEDNCECDFGYDGDECENESSSGDSAGVHVINSSGGPKLYIVPIVFIIFLCCWVYLFCGVFCCCCFLFCGVFCSGVLTLSVGSGSSGVVTYAVVKKKKENGVEMKYKKFGSKNEEI